MATWATLGRVTFLRYAGALGVASLLALLPSTSGAISGATQTATALDGVYTAEQAERGQSLYRRHCTYCHHDDLLGGEDLKVVPPALVGLAFSDRWVGKPIAELFQVLSTTMPWERTKLAPAAYADVISYLLKENGYPAGPQELPADLARLGAIRIVATR